MQYCVNGNTNILLKETLFTLHALRKDNVYEQNCYEVNNM